MQTLCTGMVKFSASLHRAPCACKVAAAFAFDYCRVTFVNVTNSTSAPQCILCKSDRSHLIVRTEFDLIWEFLGKEWGASISEDTKKAHMPSTAVGLFECDCCGVDFFWPAKSGSAQYYSELTSTAQGYYSEEKWDFDVARKILRRGDSVLDVACGDGAFIRSISDRVSIGVGIDTNPSATRSNAAANIHLVEASVEAFAKENGNCFDVVTAFQVLEHLEDVMPVASAAFDCVKPNGLLIASVPNRDRRRDEEFGSLDYPPHHMSRWSSAQFIVLAERLGGRLEDVRFQPLSRSQSIRALRNQELRRLIGVDVPGRDLLVRALSRLVLTRPLLGLWNMFRMQERLNLRGHSMVAMIRKVTDAGR